MQVRQYELVAKVGTDMNVGNCYVLTVRSRIMETIPSNLFYNSQRKPLDREQDRKRIESDVEAFLAGGGKITILDIRESAARRNIVNDVNAVMA